MKAGQKLERTFAAKRGEEGAALVVALLAMAILSLLGAGFLGRSLIETRIAENEMNTFRAFDVAEAGLEHARRELVTRGVSNLLAGTQPIAFTNGGQNVSFAGGSYSVTVADDATNSDPNVVIVTATGGYQNAIKVVQATVRIPQMPNPPGGVGAFGPEATAEVGGNSEINGHNFNPDTGALDTSVPSIPGVTFNSTDSRLKLKKDGTVDGSTGSTPYLDTTLTATDWRNFANSLLPYANFTYTSPTSVSGTQSWGTPSNPAVISVTGPADKEVVISGNVTGVGILIVGTRFKVSGTMNFQGVVIVLEDSTKKGKVDVVDLLGDAAIYGTFILASQGTGEVEYKFKLKGKGNSKIRYSKLALDRAKGALPTTLLSWHEVPIQ